MSNITNTSNRTRLAKLKSVNQNTNLTFGSGAVVSMS